MSLVSRSVRNLFRNKARTAVVVLIVGFALAIYLSASMVSASITTNIVDLSENMDTTIIVRPAGTSDFGMMTSQETMDEAILSLIWSVDHVSTMNPIISTMEQTETESTSTDFPDFRRGTMVQGMDPSQDIFLTSGGTPTISSGRSLNSSDTTAYVAVIGEEYSNTTSLSVGDTMYLNDTALTVVGVYTSGTMFGDNTVIMPYETAKVVYNLTGMNTVYVTASAVGYMDTVVANLQNILGTDYDVAAYSSITSDRADQMQASIDAVVSSSEFGKMAALLTAGAVMTFVMVLVTRERTKEIGILKAIGFKNSKIATQLVIESVALAVVGFAVALVIAQLGAPYFISMFEGTSSTSTVPTGDSTMPTPPGGQVMGLDASLTSGLVLTSLVLVVGLGIVGALYPIMTSLRLKPAEALRHDH